LKIQDDFPPAIFRRKKRTGYFSALEKQGSFPSGGYREKINRQAAFLFSYLFNLILSPRDENRLFFVFCPVLWPCLQQAGGLRFYLLSYKKPAFQRVFGV
jgi:hypothetical protein